MRVMDDGNETAANWGGVDRELERASQLNSFLTEDMSSIHSFDDLLNERGWCLSKITL
jgi:hypothetical protein